MSPTKSSFRARFGGCLNICAIVIFLFLLLANDLAVLFLFTISFSAVVSLWEDVWTRILLLPTATRDSTLLLFLLLTERDAHAPRCVAGTLVK